MGLPVLSIKSILGGNGGGSGGTTNYNQLSNKPKINSAELVGNKSTTDLGIFDIPSGNTIPSGEKEGELFLLLVDIIQASGTIKKGLYRYNGSSWERQLCEIVDIGSNQYVYEDYSLPAIAKTDLDKIYNNHKTAYKQVIKWTLLGSESYFSIVSADYIASNFSIDILVHNKYHCSYTWNASTTGLVNPQVATGEAVSWENVVSKPFEDLGEGVSKNSDDELVSNFVSGNYGKPKALSNVDLDTITTSGIYSCDVCTHRPNESNGVMLVIKNAGTSDNAVQYYSTFQNDKTYIRHRDLGTWKNWEEITGKQSLIKITSMPSSLDANALYRVEEEFEHESKTYSVGLYQVINSDLVKIGEGGSVSVDDLTIDFNSNNEIEIKNGGITIEKISSDTILNLIDAGATNEELPTAKAVYDVIKIAGHSLEASLNNTTNILTLVLKDKTGTAKSTQTIDLTAILYKTEIVDDYPTTLKEKTRYVKLERETADGQLEDRPTTGSTVYWKGKDGYNVSMSANTDTGMITITIGAVGESYSIPVGLMTTEIMGYEEVSSILEATPNQEEAICYSKEGSSVIDPAQNIVLPIGMTLDDFNDEYYYKYKTGEGYINDVQTNVLINNRDILHFNSPYEYEYCHRYLIQNMVLLNDPHLLVADNKATCDMVIYTNKVQPAEDVYVSQIGVELHSTDRQVIEEAIYTNNQLKVFNRAPVNDVVSDELARKTPVSYSLFEKTISELKGEILPVVYAIEETKVVSGKTIPVLTVNNINDIFDTFVQGSNVSVIINNTKKLYRVILATTNSQEFTTKVYLDDVDCKIEYVNDNGTVSESIIEVDVSNKLDKNNPVATGSFSIGRTGYQAAGSIAVGTTVQAISPNSVAFGSNTKAFGSYAFAEGVGSKVNDASAGHAEGNNTTVKANANYSHTEGQFTVAGSPNQHVEGKYNVVDEDSEYEHITGNGSSDSNRKNISALDWSGNLKLKGKIYQNCNDDSTGGTELESKYTEILLSGSSGTLTAAQFQLIKDDPRHVVFNSGEVAGYTLTYSYHSTTKYIYASAIGLNDTLLRIAYITVNMSDGTWTMTNHIAEDQTANRVTEITSDSTDSQYPTAKAVKTELDKKEDAFTPVVVEGTSGTFTDAEFARLQANPRNAVIERQNYIYKRTNETSTNFYCIYGTTIHQITINTTNKTWTYGASSIQNTNARTTVVNASSTDNQYPSSKAVWNALITNPFMDSSQSKTLAQLWAMPNGVKGVYHYVHVWTSGQLPTGAPSGYYYTTLLFNNENYGTIITQSVDKGMEIYVKNIYGASVGWSAWKKVSFVDA